MGKVFAVDMVLPEHEEGLVHDRAQGRAVVDAVQKALGVPFGGKADGSGVEKGAVRLVWRVEKSVAQVGEIEVMVFVEADDARISFAAVDDIFDAVERACSCEVGAAIFESQSALRKVFAGEPGVKFELADQQVVAESAQQGFCFFCQWVHGSCGESIPAWLRGKANVAELRWVGKVAAAGARGGVGPCQGRFRQGRRNLRKPCR